VSYFSPNKSDRVTKPLAAASEPRIDSVAAAPKASSRAQETVSTIGAGMLITGNIVSTGAVQVFGHVLGDIHAARLIVCEGAQVEGKILAQEAVIDGTFKGTIHANAVKLQSTAKVDGEVYNKSLSIEQNAQFEGVARRLENAVEAPSASQTRTETPAYGAAATTTAYAPAPAPAQTYAPASNYPQGLDADVVQLTPSQAYSPNNNDRPHWRG
jgi:cytoskeletal protein CcmA (bactofilin family)